MQFEWVPAFRSSRPRSAAASATAEASSGAGSFVARILDELDREHRSEAADVADLRMPLLPLQHPAPNGLADALGTVDEALVLEDVEDGERGRQRDRVADVGAADRAVAGRVHDLRLAEHARERQPGGDRLGDRDQVGLDAVVLDREHPAGAAEAGLHLVDDEDDPVPVADRAHAREELRRRDDEAALALDGLDDDRRDVLRRDLRDERALERGERGVGVDAAVLVRERHAVDLGRERAEARLVRVRLRGERERQQRAAVEAALEARSPPGARCTRART